jgi:putative transposase
LGPLVLSTIGCVRLHHDRPLAGRLTTYTITRKADGWYAHIVGDVASEPSTGKAVGVDVGPEHFATLLDGTTIPNPRWYRTAERRLKQAQRRLSRRVKGSNRYHKAREPLAKTHLKIKWARLDFIYKTACVLVNTYDNIVVEKLNIRGMVRNYPLAKSMSDAGWSILMRVLRAKAERAGRVVVEVNLGGETVLKRLAVRRHACP